MAAEDADCDEAPAPLLVVCYMSTICWPEAAAEVMPLAVVAAWLLDWADIELPLTSYCGGKRPPPAALLLCIELVVVVAADWLLYSPAGAACVKSCCYCWLKLCLPRWFLPAPPAVRLDCWRV